jgi:hypothetical protein
MQIKITEIIEKTWRLQMEPNLYSVVVVTDGKKEWARNYDNAVEAVNAYNSFVDHGFCVNERIVTLMEPHGKMHTKVFPYPTSLPIH